MCSRSVLFVDGCFFQTQFSKQFQFGKNVLSHLRGRSGFQSGFQVLPDVCSAWFKAKKDVTSESA